MSRVADRRNSEQKQSKHVGTCLCGDAQMSNLCCHMIVKPMIAPLRLVRAKHKTLARFGLCGLRNDFRAIRSATGFRSPCGFSRLPRPWRGAFGSSGIAAYASRSKQLAWPQDFRPGLVPSRLVHAWRGALVGRGSVAFVQMRGHSAWPQDNEAHACVLGACSRPAWRTSQLGCCGLCNYV